MSPFSSFYILFYFCLFILLRIFSSSKSIQWLELELMWNDSQCQFNFTFWYVCIGRFVLMHGFRWVYDILYVQCIRFHWTSCHTLILFVAWNHFRFLCPWWRNTLFFFFFWKNHFSKTNFGRLSFFVHTLTIPLFNIHWFIIERAKK